MIEIKGKKLGIGKPLVCVSVMKEEKDEIVAEVKRLSELHTEVIEWRVDAFSNSTDLNAIREVLQEIAPLVKESLLIYTFRTAGQGGLKEIDSDTLRDVHEVAAESHVVDFIDIEYFEANYPKKEIRTYQKMGTRVITSHHDFYETPDEEVLQMLLQQMKESGSDIVKLAVMPRSMEDVLLLMRSTYTFAKEYPNQPMITMAMGPMGTITRVAGEFFGSCVTFGAGAQASAPGQLPMEDLQNVLQILHENLKDETIC